MGAVMNGLATFVTSDHGPITVSADCNCPDPVHSILRLVPVSATEVNPGSVEGGIGAPGMDNFTPMVISELVGEVWCASTARTLSPETKAADGMSNGPSETVSPLIPSAG